MNKAKEIEKYNQRLIHDFIKCEGKFSDDALPNRSRELKTIKYHMAASAELRERAKKEIDTDEKRRLLEISESHLNQVRRIFNKMADENGENILPIEDYESDEAWAKEMKKLSGEV